VIVHALSEFHPVSEGGNLAGPAKCDRYDLGRDSEGLELILELDVRPRVHHEPRPHIKRLERHQGPPESKSRGVWTAHVHGGYPDARPGGVGSHGSIPYRDPITNLVALGEPDQHDNALSLGLLVTLGGDVAQVANDLSPKVRLHGYDYLIGEDGENPPARSVSKGQELVASLPKLTEFTPCEILVQDDGPAEGKVPKGGVHPIAKLDNAAHRIGDVEEAPAEKPQPKLDRVDVGLVPKLPGLQK